MTSKLIVEINYFYFLNSINFLFHPNGHLVGHIVGFATVAKDLNIVDVLLM